MNQYQAQPPARRSYGLSVTLLVIGGVCLAAAAAMMWSAFDIADNDPVGGVGSGDAEGAGFLFMTALCPAALGFILVVSGLVALFRAKSRRPPVQP